MLYLICTSSSKVNPSFILSVLFFWLVPNIMIPGFFSLQHSSFYWALLLEVEYRTPLSEDKCCDCVLCCCGGTPVCCLNIMLADAKYIGCWLTVIDWFSHLVCEWTLRQQTSIGVNSKLTASYTVLETVQTLCLSACLCLKWSVFH